MGRDDTFTVGLMIIAMNWLPGVVASIHLLSMYRAKLPPQKTILYAGKTVSFNI